MRLTILGCYAATPRTFTNPTSQVLEINKELVLIDCAEGTQVELRRNKLKFSRIKHIFISHLHGDHFYGLVGLISSFGLLQREKELHVYGPKGIKEIITLQLKLAKAWTSYPLYFHELESEEATRILETDRITVDTIPLDHRIYTNGFLFTEKPDDRKLLIEKVRKYDIDIAYYRSIKKGKDIKLDDGRVISNAELTEDPPLPKSYAYCSDTAYFPELTDQIRGTTVLYHEATFVEEHAEVAAATKHSTAKQAARIALQANVGKLILGHYSTRYEDINKFKIEAEEIFPIVELADDGKVFVFEESKF